MFRDTQFMHWQGGIMIIQFCNLELKSYDELKCIKKLELEFKRQLWACFIRDNSETVSFKQFCVFWVSTITTHNCLEYKFHLNPKISYKVYPFIFCELFISFIPPKIKINKFERGSFGDSFGIHSSEQVKCMQRDFRQRRTTVHTNSLEIEKMIHWSE